MQNQQFIQSKERVSRLPPSSSMTMVQMVTPHQTDVANTIEPELLLARPRPVRLSKHGTKIQAWSVTFLAAFLTGINLLPPSFTYLKGITWMNVVLQVLIQYVLRALMPSAFPADHKRMLKYWSVARATIVSESVSSFLLSHPDSPEKQTVRFSYTYVAANGTTFEHTIKMKRKHAWQRGLAVGSSFSVLYDPEKAEVGAVPYFNIRDAEIVGATGAKVTIL